jgi:hypothetical protein
MQPLFQSAQQFYEKTDPYFVTNGSVCGSGRPKHTDPTVSDPEHWWRPRLKLT